MTHKYLSKFQANILKVLILLCASNLSCADTHKPQEFLQAIHGSPNEAEQIYTHFCINCHANKPLIPMVHHESKMPRIGRGDKAGYEAFI